MPDAGRVITGSAGGLRLEAPGATTRPLGDRVKQSLFASVEAEREDVWEHPFLDLFAGSGAGGIEALSRGAPHAVLVERDARAASAIRRNLVRTGVHERALLVRTDVASFLRAGPGGFVMAPFGAVLLDPPYARSDALVVTLNVLGAAAAGWLDAEAVVVAKHLWKAAPPAEADDLALVRSRRFGETALSVYRRRRQHAVRGTS